METDRRKSDYERQITEHAGHKIVTGMIDNAEEKSLSPFRYIFGNDDGFENAFNLYFHWFNLIHELAHIARIVFKLRTFDSEQLLMEEKFANDFAVAYWREFGEAAKLVQIRTIVERALSYIEDPCPGIDFLNYFQDVEKFKQASQSPNDYGFIQFSLVLSALENVRWDFETGLRQQGFRISHGVVDKKLKYIHPEKQMQTIVDDAIEILDEFGLSMDRVVVIEHFDPHVHMALPVVSADERASQ